MKSSPQLNVQEIVIAAAVIRQADRQHLADAVLRDELRRRRDLSPVATRAVAQTVFAYYRWFGWLDAQSPLDAQIHQARQLADRFAREPGAFSDQELVAKAVPPWVAETMQVTPAWARALQSLPRLWLRARKGQGSALAAQLGACRPFDSGALADALEYTGDQDLFRTPAFHAGAFEVQDLASQAVSLVCQPQPSETWWDACAGEGGKTLHLSALMENRGLIWATDRAAWRLQRLKRRAARSGVFNYRAAEWNNLAKPPVRTKFDGVLVDAPCSGLGTWQRNPQARWTTTPQDVAELSEIQRQLLALAATALKPGGKLVYSVCTLIPAETTAVAAALGAQFPELEPLPFPHPLTADQPAHSQCWLLPEEFGGNGMFIAAWQKKRQ